MMKEWYCSRLVKNVSSAAVPIAPPRLRSMLNRPDALPASIGVMPTMAMADSGVITSAWPNARVTSGTSSCGAA